MRELWKRFRACIRAQAPELLSVLRRGVSKVAIARAEKKMGVKFPEDFAAFYAVHNGQPRESSGLINLMTISSLARVVSNWSCLTGLLREGVFDGIRSDPDGPSKPEWWNARWIPFVENWSGDHICLDLDPPRKGRVGQVIRFWHDVPERQYEARSFREWLEGYVRAVEEGEYVYSSKCGGIVEACDA
jgi:cell wall assembly regulator SMI1